MNTVATDRERGYSLVEVVVALSIGLLVVTSAFVAGASGDELSIRRSLSTTVSLRNQLGQASMWPTETAAVGWN